MSVLQDHHGQGHQWSTQHPPSLHFNRQKSRSDSALGPSPFPSGDARLSGSVHFEQFHSVSLLAPKRRDSTLSRFICAVTKGNVQFHLETEPFSLDSFH